MVFVLTVILFAFGCAIGSFLNVLIDRIPRGESISRGRSHCDSCKKTLQWYDLIPLLSFVSIGGKCRYCRAKLSWFYPLIETTTGVLFVLTFLFLTQNPEFSVYDPGSVVSLLYYLFVISILIVLFFTDLRSGIIPFVVIMPAIAVSVLYLLFLNPLFITQHLLAALSGFIFFLFLFLVTKGRGMGFGDVVLAFYMGLLLRYPGIITAYYIAFLTGAGVSLILILGKKKKFSGGTIPFGPFLILGTLISLFFGEYIFNFALQFFYG